MSDNLRTVLDADWLRSALGECHTGLKELKSRSISSNKNVGTRLVSLRVERSKVLYSTTHGHRVRF